MERGVSVWFDEFDVQPGESLREAEGVPGLVEGW
jgi:hypothetical protein